MTNEKIILKFNAQHGIYNAGDCASFEQHIADRLLDAKITNGDGRKYPLCSVVKIEAEKKEGVDTHKAAPVFVANADVEHVENVPSVDHVEQEKVGFLKRGRPRKG